MVVGGGDLGVDMDSSFVREKPHHEHNAGSVEAEPLQRADQTEPIVGIDDSDEAPPSIAEFSEQTLTLLTAPYSSLPDLGGGGPAIVDISKFTTVTIVDKRSSSSGVEYKLATNLVGKAQMGRVHIRSYENGFVRAARFKTLRVGSRLAARGLDVRQVGKRKFSQM